MTKYVTLVNKNYVILGMAMIDSLFQFEPDAEVFVWVLDEETKALLKQTYLDRVTILSSDYVDARWPHLKHPPTPRNYWESLDMRRSCLLLSLLSEEVSENELLIYLDADCWIFSSFQPALKLMEGGSIGLSPHGFSPRHAWLLKNGEFNSGCVMLRNNETSRACMRDWVDDCFEWCHTPAQDGKFMNQGYLTHWPQLYAGVVRLTHPGMNLAPWNVEGRALTTHKDGLKVEGKPLLFYHFHGVTRQKGAWENDSPLVSKSRNPEVFEHVYAPYSEELRRIEARLAKLGFNADIPPLDKYEKAK